MSVCSTQQATGAPLLLTQFVRKVLVGDNTLTCTQEELKALMPIAEAHDLAHFIGAVLLDDSTLCVDESKEAGLNAYRRAVYRHGLMQYEEERVNALLEEMGIDHIRLKGSVLKEIYPHPWLRTCADVDILVPEKDIKRVARLLAERFEYRIGKEGGHDLSLHSPSGVHFEMHFCLNERDRLTDRYLKQVWQYATLLPGTQHSYQLPDAYFYLYQTSHAMKHFVLGGCGVRTITDFWLMSRELSLTPDSAKELLEACELMPFAQAITHLGKVWFEDAEHTDLTRTIEQYILLGGVFGTEEQAALLEQSRGGSRIGYFFRRLFLPLAVLREDYPILNKYPIFYLFCQMHRWFTLLINKEKRESAIHRARYSGDRETYLHMIKALKVR